MTMMINVINLPVVNIIFYFLGSFRRCMDRGFTLDVRNTKKKTQKQWEDLYTGSEFLIEFRYAQVLIFYLLASCMIGFDYQLRYAILFTRNPHPVLLNPAKYLYTLLDGQDILYPLSTL